jgi:hypothetical protein
MECRNERPTAYRLILLIFSPFVDPFCLNLFKVFFGRAIFGTGKAGNLQNPYQQFGKTDSVDFTLVEFVAEAFVKGYGNIFVIGPAEGEFVKIFETQGEEILVC